MAAIHTMFSAVVGLPLFDPSNPQRVGAMCMLYVSASDNAGILEYFDSYRVEVYLYEIASTLALALEFSKRVSVFNAGRTDLTSERAARVKTLWRAVR